MIVLICEPMNIKPQPLTIGTPVIAYGIETTITEVQPNPDDFQHTNYRVADLSGYMWHCELEVIPPKVDTCPDLESDAWYQAWLAGTAL